MQRTFKRRGFVSLRHTGLARRPEAPIHRLMTGERAGQIAVIFVSRRNAEDDAGYAGAAAAMGALAAEQPGYCGIVSVRDAEGLGITVSYWADEASAKAWRDNPDHARIRAAGRERWYDSYEVVVAEATRSYDWRRG